MKWVGLDDAETTWEPVSRVLADVPVMLKKELRLMWLSTDFFLERRRPGGISYSCSVSPNADGSALALRCGIFR